MWGHAWLPSLAACVMWPTVVKEVEHSCGFAACDVKGVGGGEKQNSPTLNTTDSNLTELNWTKHSQLVLTDTLCFQRSRNFLQGRTFVLRLGNYPACRLTGGRALPASEHAVSPRLCKQPRVNMQSTAPGRTAAGRWDVCLSARRAQSALLPFRRSPSPGSRLEVRVPQVQVQKHGISKVSKNFFYDVRLGHFLLS